MAGRAAFWTDCSEIIFEDGLAQPGVIPVGAFYMPGETIGPEHRGTPVGIKGLYRVTVKPAWKGKGKVIACQFTHTAWGLMNLPYELSLQPFEYNEAQTTERAPRGRRR